MTAIVGLDGIGLASPGTIIVIEPRLIVILALMPEHADAYDSLEVSSVEVRAYHYQCVSQRMREWRR